MSPLKSVGRLPVLSKEKDFSLWAEMGTFQVLRKKKVRRWCQDGGAVASISACACSKGQENWVGIQLLSFITVNTYWLLGKESRLSTSGAPAISLHGCWCSCRIDARTLWPSVNWGGGETELEGFPGDFSQQGRNTQIWLKVWLFISFFFLKLTNLSLHVWTPLVIYTSS